MQRSYMILDPIDPRERQRRWLVSVFAAAFDLPVSDVDVEWDDDNETITVTNFYRSDSIITAHARWVHQITSDDDRYVFRNAVGSTFIFPLEA